MPTILRYRGFLIMIYIDDHDPAHIHAVRGRSKLVLNLPCSGGSLSVRSSRGLTAAEERMLIVFVGANVDLLCNAWKELHGERNQ